MHCLPITIGLPAAFSGHHLDREQNVMSEELADTLKFGTNRRPTPPEATARFRAQVAEEVTGCGVSQMFFSVVTREHFISSQFTAAFIISVFTSGMEFLVIL